MSNVEMYDVVVVGAGNAALNAAISAREQRATVLVLEKAPVYFRGGNSYFTAGGFRFTFDDLEDILKMVPDMSEEEARAIEVGSYTETDFYNDVMRVTEGLTDTELLNVLVAESRPTVSWMMEKGIRWIPMYGRQAFKIGDRFRFWGGIVLEAVGGGQGLCDKLFEVAQEIGVDVRYETKGSKLLLDRKGRVSGVTVRDPEGYRDIKAKAVVLACGGFEANAEMRTRYLGPGWELAKVRGTQFNTGDGIRMALDIGAQSYGNWSGCHSVAWDLNAPPYGDRKIGDLFQKHSYPLGIVVNIHGQRFVDEGADFRNYTYAKYGAEILKQPERVAFQIFDDKVKHLLRDEYRIAQVTMATANTIEELASGLGIDPRGLVNTVTQFNGAVMDKEFNPAILDGKGTMDIYPPKTHWALPIDKPPFLGYAVTCGITFTFGGLRINTQAQVQDTEERTMPGLWAAGELVGGLFYQNYPGGSGLMAGSVFGRIAGRGAAQYALGQVG